MIESIAESLHFASKQPNSPTVLTDSADDDGIQRRNDASRLSDDIEMVDR